MCADRALEYVGYYNGEIGDLTKMQIPMLDRVVFFGDSCYDMATFRHKRAFALMDHIRRFFYSCQSLGIETPWTADGLAAELQRCIDRCASDRGSIYWQASRGTRLRSFAYGDDVLSPNLIAYAGPAELEPEGTVYHLRTQADTRYQYCFIKTTNLIPAVLFSQQAWKDGCQESILHRDGMVTECAHSNVVFLKDGVLRVKPQDHRILPGVTMNILLVLARELGIPVETAPFSLEELEGADEILITSTGVPLIPGITLDGRAVGGKAPQLLKKIREAYLAFYEINTSRKEILDQEHYTPVMPVMPG